MGDPFEGWDPLQASVPWEEWRAQFLFMLILGYGSKLPIGEKQVAAKMAKNLYNEGLDTKDACYKAMASAHKAPAAAKLDAANSFRQASSRLEKTYPLIFGSKEEIASSYYDSFQGAADVAIDSMKLKTKYTIAVVPASDGKWRVISVKNREALRSDQKRDWVMLWEVVQRQLDEAQRKKVLHFGLIRLVRNGNGIARQAQNEVDLHAIKKKRSPGFDEGSVLFSPLSTDQPFFRG